MKFCINCQHFTPFKNANDDGYCSRPQLGINLVNGEPNTKVCSGQRTNNSSSSCGSVGYYFELKVIE